MINLTACPTGCAHVHIVSQSTMAGPTELVLSIRHNHLQNNMLRVGFCFSWVGHPEARVGQKILSARGCTSFCTTEHDSRAPLGTIAGYHWAQ